MPGLGGGLAGHEVSQGMKRRSFFAVIGAALAARFLPAREDVIYNISPDASPLIGCGKMPIIAPLFEWQDDVLVPHYPGYRFITQISRVVV